jgi:broad specificity phosphatase PhoE
LSEAGLVAAAELGARRRSDGIAVVYVSDLQRARETAKLAFEGSGMPIIEDARLRECNYGRQNGMPRARLEGERARHVERPWPGGESYLDVVARTAEFLADVARRHDGQRVLAISHSANQWAIGHLLLGEDLASLVAAGMTWQPGWEFVLPAAWTVTDNVAQPGSKIHVDE